MDHNKRKMEHIELTSSSQAQAISRDPRFYYEPMFGSFKERDFSQNFLGKKIKYPIWVSSMTGGTEQAFIINKNLSTMVAKFELGMGLGSCRVLLDDKSRLKDFDHRHRIGDERPFLGNIGICQLDQLLTSGEIEKLFTLVELLKLDGIFIHINPLQELIQKEGDDFKRPSLEIIEDFLKRKPSFKIVVKEVGQGMGPKSLKALLDLPIDGIELAAFGGTNFAKLESLRNGSNSSLSHFTTVGHTALEMIENLASLLKYKDLTKIRCKNFILSGGVKSYFDGFYLLEFFKKSLGEKSSEISLVYGQAKSMLDHATGDLSILEDYIRGEIKGLNMAYEFLTLR